jgi:hypothetical protein
MAKHIKEMFFLQDYWQEAIKNPETAPIPEVMATAARLVMLAARNVEPETFHPFLTYVQRMDLQWQVLFALSLFEGRSTESKAAVMAYTSKPFAKWLMANKQHL